MTMLDEMKTTCIMMDRTTAPDGLGGIVRVWTDGASFNATITKDTSMNARIAEKDGVKETYTVIVDKGIPLQYHDVFRRESDGQIFRVTSNIQDSEAPARSTVKIGKVAAERYELNND